MASRTIQQAALFVACSIGLACWWPFFRNSYLGMVFYEDVSGVSSGLLLGIVVLGIGLFGAACFFVPWTRRRIDAASMTVSCAASLLSVASGCIDTAAASVASALCLSLAAASSAIGWFSLLCRLLWPVSASILATSFFLSFFLPYVAHFYGEGAMAFLNDALMPVSAACLCGALALLRFDEGLPFGRKEARPNADMKEMAVVLVLFLVVGAVFRGCFGQGSLDYSPAAEGEFRYVTALVLSGALIAFTFSFSRQPTFFVVVWAVLAFAFFAGLVVLSALALPADEIWSSVVITSRTFMGLLLWMVAVRFCQGRTATMQVRCVSTLLLGVETACLVLTAFVSPFVDRVLGGFDPALASCAMALVLVAGSFAYLIALVVRGSFGVGYGKESRHVPACDLSTSACHGSESSRDAAAGPFAQDGAVSDGAVRADALCGDAALSEAGAARIAACRALSEKHGITEREEEVLYQLSLGHSVKKVADTLVISAGTVQSHIKRIYRKLDCHSRQELIDLVDETMHVKNALADPCRGQARSRSPR